MSRETLGGDRRLTSSRIERGDPFVPFRHLVTLSSDGFDDLRQNGRNAGGRFCRAFSRLQSTQASIDYRSDDGDCQRRVGREIAYVGLVTIIVMLDCRLEMPGERIDIGVTGRC